MLGLARGVVKVVDYDYKWKEEFIKEKDLLKASIGEYILDIEHVGSTSIEGLASKPIIDIALGVKSLEDASKFNKKLETIGYNFRGNAGVEGRYLFAKGEESYRTHYLHVEVYGDKLWKNHIYFRNYLMLHKEYIKEYELLKKTLEIEVTNCYR